jgi:hypothetical protein
MILSRSGGHFYLARSGHLYLAPIVTGRITGEMVNRSAVLPRFQWRLWRDVTGG